ncbi:hypothetical protein UFOVP1462_23 [uncultured Caudovirales phage]|uniref:Uncharacterized protein n=1 Tax=uncultured Caudovirales phage TaxID=2100421 RepID=A0A6J5SJA2_9CAUD|nr:hypothetical protein UFOVP1013_23 [uncultured Caudovirales phage]CAB4202846.1 hypothetical protein UFOVP1364_40 [uncultured Caudovirales phage]CAB4214211.1 hypothetical protein UFOVP1462_23 [uncultured Caudovirales phage]CAB5228744.1 hypothetical protein UFOVP1550_32 [uncultured Caudovirales phage]
MIKTKAFKGSWLGRVGVSWEYRRGKGTSATGKRVVCHLWADTQTLEMKFCKGDGRKSDFVVYETHVIKDGTESHADRLATYWLDPNGKTPTVIKETK